MAMRDLVSGGAACAVPGSSSAANPLGSLANALVGSSSKTQERLNEIPTSTTTGSTQGAALYQENPADYFRALPGNELDHSLHVPNAQGAEFLNGFRSADRSGLADAWNEVQHSSVPMPHGGVPHWDHMYDHRLGSQLQPTLDGPPQRVLSSVLHSFVGSSYGGAPFLSTPLPQLGLSEGDKQCIRDRSSIMARHFFGDKSEDFINQQVNALLSSLDIDNSVQAKGPMSGRFGEFEGYWNESQGPLASRPHGADGWIDEFSQQSASYGNPDAWASSFEKQHGANGWASQFEQEQRLATVNRLGGAGGSHLAAMEQSRRLAHTLTQNNDPKFQNSKFLQFVSKMSRGELIMDENQVKPATSYSGDDWTTEYQQQYASGSSWADEYAAKIPQGPDHWVNEFAGGREQIESGDQWVDEFSKFQINDWVEEYSQQAGGDAHAENNTTDNWTNEFGEYLGKQKSDRGIYVFSDMNPYVGHSNPLKEGQELFRKGLLSEAVLALEAEVMKNPDNAEVWRLLGIAHAENDDDQQAIAAMMSAQKADPTNLEVLLSLGVSHTNELEQAAALKYLYGWLHDHPKYGTIAPPHLSDSLYHADVARLFNDAAQMSPEDADVHIVLGVLYNLSREYDKAIASFKIALKLKPQDYSLWNKLGATQANSVQSADAILAYQKALDLKPNYVRAWANIGISYANQGLYEESIRYYVRALAMNPKADNAWQYLKISLRYASRTDMLEACESRNLDLLQKEFPL